MSKLRRYEPVFRALPLLATLIVACGDSHSESAIVGAASSPVVVSKLATEHLRHSRVLQTIEKVTNQLVTIRTTQDVIVTTPDHLFARFEGGWVPAARLSVGDRLVSSASASGAAILELQTKPAPGTKVYNLTVERTHTYLVGSGRVLVHNVDCQGEHRPTLEELLNRRRKIDEVGEHSGEERKKKTLGEYLAEEREQERQQQQERERERDRLRAQLQDFREDHERRLESLRRQAAHKKKKFNDSKGETAFGNCVYCTLGGLSDYDKLSVFLKDSNLNDKQDVSPRRNYELLERLGLRRRGSDDSQEPNRFQDKNPRKAQQDAEEFMRKADENTFALIIKGAPRAPIAHSLIAVRKPDGSIVYIDLQKVPPATFDHLNPGIGVVEVIPTVVDWRFNRQLAGAVRDSPRTNPKRGWPNW